jgi:hypothetical protein
MTREGAAVRCAVALLALAGLLVAIAATAPDEVPGRPSLPAPGYPLVWSPVAPEDLDR